MGIDGSRGGGSQNLSNEQRTANLWWLAWILILVALDFIIPYTVLKDIPSLWGAYLFWVVITIIAIVSAVLYMRRWTGIATEEN